MTDNDLRKIVDDVAAASGYSGLDSSTMYGEFALDVARAAMAAERERTVLAFAEFLHSMPEEDGYSVGPVRVKYSPAGLLVDGPLWATQEDTARWARAFLAGPNAEVTR